MFLQGCLYQHLYISLNSTDVREGHFAKRFRVVWSVYQQLKGSDEAKGHSVSDWHVVQHTNNQMENLFMAFLPTSRNLSSLLHLYS